MLVFSLILVVNHPSNYAGHTKQPVQLVSLSPNLITQINGQDSDGCNCLMCRFKSQIMVT